MLAREVVRALEDLKAENIILMDVQGQCMFADYFVIGSGTSDRMLSALAKTVKEAAHQSGGSHVRLEGRPEHGWVLVDMGSVIAHIFLPDLRKYYDLEGLWSEGKVLLRIQ